MAEVSGPVIAIVFVLCAVFIPVAFLGGIAGQLYRQFAVTISISCVISGIVALTLSPALAAVLLKERKEESKFTKSLTKLLSLWQRVQKSGTATHHSAGYCSIVIFSCMRQPFFFKKFHRALFLMKIRDILWSWAIYLMVQA